MKFLVSMKSIVVGVCALSFSAGLPADKAAAQGWGWGNSGSKAAPSKHLVSFKTKHKLLARWLSVLVIVACTMSLKGKRAISYPIAVPKANAKWSGNYQV